MQTCQDGFNPFIHTTWVRLSRTCAGGGDLRKVVSAGAAEGRKALRSYRGEVDHIFRGPDSEVRVVPLYRAVLVNNYSFQGVAASEEKRK